MNICKVVKTFCEVIHEDEYRQYLGRLQVNFKVMKRVRKNEIIEEPTDEKLTEMVENQEDMTDIALNHIIHCEDCEKIFMK